MKGLMLIMIFAGTCAIAYSLWIFLDNFEKIIIGIRDLLFDIIEIRWGYWDAYEESEGLFIKRIYRLKLIGHFKKTFNVRITNKLDYGVILTGKPDIRIINE